MEEDYVPFEIAKMLKEKGFDEGCSFVVNAISKGVMPVSWPTANSDIEDERANLIALPTLQMAMKWLRETHKIVIEISAIYGSNEDYSYTYVIRNKEHCLFRKFFETYEDACETAIKYCLENLV